jgi:hypothetical protein
MRIMELAAQLGAVTERCRSLEPAVALDERRAPWTTVGSPEARGPSERPWRVLSVSAAEGEPRALCYAELHGSCHARHRCSAPRSNALGSATHRDPHMERSIAFNRARLRLDRLTRACAKTVSWRGNHECRLRDHLTREMNGCAPTPARASTLVESKHRHVGAGVQRVATWELVEAAGCTVNELRRVVADADLASIPRPLVSGRPDEWRVPSSGDEKVSRAMSNWRVVDRRSSDARDLPAPAGRAAIPEGLRPRGPWSPVGDTYLTLG